MPPISDPSGSGEYARNLYPHMPSVSPGILLGSEFSVQIHQKQQRFHVISSVFFVRGLQKSDLKIIWFFKLVESETAQILFLGNINNPFTKKYPSKQKQ